MTGSHGFEIVDCRACRGAGHATCQCPAGEMLKDGQTARFGMLFRDHAAVAVEDRYRDSESSSPERKAHDMMTDSESHAMRDSVKGMPLQRAAALPIYDDIRSCIMGGRPAAEYYAILDGAVPNALGSLPVTPENICLVGDNLGAYLVSVQNLNRWRG